MRTLCHILKFGISAKLMIMLKFFFQFTVCYACIYIMLCIAQTDFKTFSSHNCKKTEIQENILVLDVSNKAV